MSTPTPEQLFEANLDLALRIARSFPLVGHAIDESEQEARIALWKATNSYDPVKGEFEPFASTVIRNHLRNAYEKTKRRSVEVTALDAPSLNQPDTDGGSLKDTSILSPDASPLLEAERNDIRATLRDGMAYLTPTQQEALQAYADGSNYAEIAREKGVSKAAVRQMVQRAADQVRPEIVSRGVSGIAFMPASLNEPDLQEAGDYGFSHYMQKPPSGKGGYLLILIVVVIVLIVLAIPILSAALGR
jgi:RNA polymerase sigma factor (sigma-70 family)